VTKKSKKLDEATLIWFLQESWVKIGVVEGTLELEDRSCEAQQLLNRLAYKNHRKPFTLKETQDWLLNSSEEHPVYSDQEIVQIINEKFNPGENLISPIILGDEQLEFHPFVRASSFSKALGLLEKSIESIHSIPDVPIQVIAALGNARNELMLAAINNEKYCEID
jgi:hypothetical protein